MTYPYSYDSLPKREIPLLPLAVRPLAMQTVRELLEDTPALDALVVGAAHVYVRKEELDADALGGHRNPAYGSASDDVVLQVTLRVSVDKVRELIARATEVHQAEEAAAIAAEEADIEAQIASLQARKAGLAEARS